MPTGVHVASRTYHLSPEPWPVTSPGALSWANVYSGQPSHVACGGAVLRPRGGGEQRGVDARHRPSPDRGPSATPRGSRPCTCSDPAHRARTCTASSRRRRRGPARARSRRGRPSPRSWPDAAAAVVAVAASSSMPTGVHVASRTYHFSPESWPVTSPGALSWANVYSGQPSQVACSEPSSGRGAVASIAASTPSPAVAGPASAGHASRQPPVHVLGALRVGHEHVQRHPGAVDEDLTERGVGDRHRRAVAGRRGRRRRGGRPGARRWLPGPSVAGAGRPSPTVSSSSSSPHAASDEHGDAGDRQQSPRRGGWGKMVAARGASGSR